MPALLLLTAVLILPAALSHPGFNGASALGVALTILAVGMTVATHPRKDSK